VPAILVIIGLVCLAVGCGRATARGGRTAGRTVLVTGICAVTALGCLVGTVLLIPCAYQQLFPDPLRALMGTAQSSCPSLLQSGDR
jgi:hypothetical protein